MPWFQVDDINKICSVILRIIKPFFSFITERKKKVKKEEERTMNYT